MASIGDFHLHSTHSDGRLTPVQLAELAHQNGVRYLALTDHDTVAGLDEMRAALGRYPEMTLIPGVELSVEMEQEVHLLGYWMDEQGPTFQRELARFREGRLGRGQEMVRKLTALGMPIEWERVLQIAGEASVGRPHVALALLEKGYVSSLNEAFDQYLHDGGPAYVSREKLTPEEAIRMVNDAGGVVVVAHPQFIGLPKRADADGVTPFDDPAYRTARDGALERLVRAGAAGMEVYYKRNAPELVAELKAVADRLGLLPLGGSDYHALGREDECLPGDIPLPDEAIEPFMELGRGRPGWSGT
jgi:predicted metal-dependent phosphoesterase TrpH